MAMPALSLLARLNIDFLTECLLCSLVFDKFSENLSGLPISDSFQSIKALKFVLWTDVAASVCKGHAVVVKVVQYSCLKSPFHFYGKGQ